MPPFARYTPVFAGAALLLALLADPGGASGPATATVSPAQTQATSAAKAPPAAKPAAPAAIPLANVATQAAAVATYLGSISPLAGDDPKVKDVEGQFPQLTALIDRDLPVALQLLREQPSLGKLQDLGQLWGARQQQLTQWLAVLTGRADQLQGALDRIGTLQQTWQLTRAAAQATKAPPQVIQQAEGVLTSLGNAQTPLEARRSAVLVVQDLISRQLTRCGTVLAGLSTAQQQAMGSILAQDTPPLWSVELRRHAGEQLGNRLSSYGAGIRSDLVTFLREPPRAFFFQAGLFLFLYGLIAFMGRRIRDLSGTEEFHAAFVVLMSPLHAALVGSLIYGSVPWLPYPQTIRMLMEVLAIFPMVWLARPALNRRLVTLLYALAALFILDTIRQGLAGAPLLEQALLLTEAGIGMALLLGLLAVNVSGSDEALPKEGHLVRGIVRLALLILLVGIGATTFGYLRLARLLVSSVFGGGFLALALFTFIRLMTGISAFLMRNWPLSSLGMVSRHTDLLERRIYSVLFWAACTSWLGRILDYVGLLNPVLEFGKSVLAARLVRSSFSISLGDVIACGLTVWLAFLFSAFIRFVLSEDVYPRVRTAPGVSYALSSLLHYLILVVGFVVAVGELGVSLNRVIILLSAFGVGIGFGLQNVVNNLISGVVLLFERPINVGDTVEFGPVLGQVRQINLRSSKVRTLTGADIIVPNAQFISEQVTNWTLSDKLRRIDLPVGVNYGADPRQVITLLEGVAHANPRILSAPPPQCLFTGYGDSSITFELRAWTDQFGEWYQGDWFQIRSELAVAVYAAVQKAGMSFPFPQREVRLLHEPEGGVPAAGEKSGRDEQG